MMETPTDEGGDISHVCHQGSRMSTQKKQVKTADGYSAAVMQNMCKWDAAVKSALLQKCSSPNCQTGLQ